MTVEEQYSKMLNSSFIPQDVVDEDTTIKKNSVSMSEDDINDISEELEKNISESSKTMRDLNNGLLVPDEKENEMEELFTDGDLEVDPKFANISIDELKNFQLNTDALKPDQFKELGLDDTDAKCIVDILTRKRNGEQFSIYGAMTSNLKGMVAQLASTGNRDPKSVAKDLMDHFLRDAVIEQEYIDFNTSLAKTLKMDSTVSLYTSKIKDQMEVELPKIADKLEDKDPDKAKSLRDITEAFKDSYMFNTVLYNMNNNGLLRKKYKKDALDLRNATAFFNNKYQNSTYAITNINLIIPVLVNHFPEVDEKYIHQFVAVLCRTFLNYSPEIVTQHVLMYYTISNIINLGYAGDEIDESGFFAELKLGIKKVLDKLIEMEVSK